MDSGEWKHGLIQIPQESIILRSSKGPMPNLWEQLGLDPAELNWQDLALCRGMVTSPDNDIFFDAYESSEEIAKATDEMCLRCPVIKQCFFTGAKGGIGVRGGVYWNGSGKPDKNKNSHKTEDVWDQIRERVSQADD